MNETEKKINMKAQIINEIDLASNVAFRILTEFEETNIDIEDVDSVLGMATEMVRTFINKTVRSEKECGCNKSKRKNNNKRTNKCPNEQISKAKDVLDHMFRMAVLGECSLAKMDDRDIDLKHLKATADRLVKACFKNVKGVNVNDIRSKVVVKDGELCATISIGKQ